MRVLCIIAAHGQHIMSLGDSKPAQSAGSPSFVVLQSAASPACNLQQTLLVEA